MKKKVLIVDDDGTNRYMLETLLKGYGFEVISAENGRDALDKAYLTLPDLIITDILMPVMDGYALCRRWKSDDSLKHIPLVFYTATYTGSKNEDFALSLGAERFILKPQEPDILMNILKEVLEENYSVKQVATKPLEEEMEVFRQYNEILFKKLEKKMMDLEIANQELRILEEQYRLSFENVSDVIYTIDTDLNIISVSPSVERVLGYKPEDFIGRPVSDLGHILMPESLEQAIADIILILKGESIQSTIYRFIAKDRTIKYGEVSGSPLMREGKVIGMISVARDITDRKRADEKLQTLSSRQEAILAAVPDIIMEVDNNQVYTWANLAGIEFFGEDVIGKEAAFYFEGEQETYDTVKTIFCGAEETIYVESWQRRRDGEKRLLAWWCRVLRDASGQVLGALSSARDITERKQAEKALQESENKYRDLYDFLPIPVYEMDLGANITSANRAIYETFRGTEEDLKKSFKVYQLFLPEDIDKASKNIGRLLQGERIRGTEYTLLRLDGSTFPAIVISSVIYSNGKPVGLRGAIIDITERRHQEEDLRRVTAFLDSIIENIPNMVFLKDAKELRFVRFNRAGEELLGYSRDDLLGKNDYDFFPKEQADFFIERDREVLQGKDVVDIPEEPIQTRTKGERILHTKKVPILGTNGEPEYLLGISEDITKRKRAEEALKESEEQYRSLFENANEAIFVVQDNKLVFLNPMTTIITGYSGEELMSRPFIEFIHADDREMIIDRHVRRMKGEKLPHRYSFRILHKNGNTKWVELNAVLMDWKGKPATLNFLSDINERKMAEVSLKKSEARFRSYFELPLVGIAITSPEKGWLEVNNRMSEIIGYSREELKDMTWSEITHPEDIDADVAQFNRVVAGEIDSYVIDKRFIRKDGETIWTSLAAGCIRKKDGKVDYFVVLVEDIADRKKSVERLRKSLGATIQAMAVTVEARDPYTAGHQRRVSDLARTIAAEMNLSGEQIDGIRMAATIHDLGKISVPAEILSKPTRLTMLEFSLIKTHAQSGYDILKDIDFPWPIARMVLEHHERLDGSGYPQGLTKDNLLLESRILSVADVVEAMASHRPYRPSLGIDAALEEIEKNKGTHYDNTVVDACLRLFREKGYQLERI